MFVPSENCHIVFALENLKSPQPSLAPGVPTRGQVRAAEPYGDASKRHARLSILQRTVDIICKGVTQGGVITGELFVGGGAQRRDFSLEMVGSGLASVDQRKIEYGEAPKVLVDAQNRATDNRVGLWSMVQKKQQAPTKTVVKAKEEMAQIQLSEIRSGSHFYFTVVGNKAASVIKESMKIFTAEHGINGAPVDLKAGKVVAALFIDGQTKSWYRAKILDKRIGKVRVLFIDHGNIATVPIASHLRPLDSALGVDRIPPVAKEGVLALTKVRSLDEDDGVDAARYFQQIAWGKELAARIFCESEGKLAVALYLEDISSSVNEQLTREGLARAPKELDISKLADLMSNSENLTILACELNEAESAARKARRGLWRYGDVGDDDEE